MDTIAKNSDEYVEMAVRLGSDVAWRREISAQMKTGAAAVFSDVSAVRGLEDWLTDAVKACA